MKYWQIIIEISAMLDGIAAVWRLWMAKADQFGLSPQSAVTQRRFIVQSDQESIAFVELESAIQTDRQNQRADESRPETGMK